MGKRKTPGRPWTSETAPRAGGKAGRKVRLNAQAWKAIEMYLADFSKRGQKAINALFIERPSEYVKLGLDLSAKIAMNESVVDNSVPMRLVVRWGEPRVSAPQPLPETASPISSPTAPSTPLPTMTPASPVKLLPFHRLSD